ncbi:hypothetical protein NPIL_102701, partial [Nephila pilipes]
EKSGFKEKVAIDGRQEHQMSKSSTWVALDSRLLRGKSLRLDLYSFGNQLNSKFRYDYSRSPNRRRFNNNVYDFIIPDSTHPVDLMV